MSKTYPDCPLSNHLTCKYYGLVNLCAIVRTDKTCHKKKNNGQDRKHRKKEAPIEQPAEVSKLNIGARRGGAV